MRLFRIRHQLAFIRARIRNNKEMEALEPYIRRFQIAQRLEELTKVDLLTVDQDTFDEVLKYLKVDMTIVNRVVKERQRGARD